VPILGAEKRTPTTEVLARALQDRDLDVRARAVERLGVLSQSKKGGVKKEVARVLGLALRDRDPGIRLQAVEKLGKMEGKFANKYLLWALRDPNTFIRDRVVRVLDERERLLLQPPPAPQPQAQGEPTAGAP
jgi:HEAT repeat protein